MSTQKTAKGNCEEKAASNEADEVFGGKKLLLEDLMLI